MKKIFKSVLSLIAVLVLAVSFAACKSTATLEDYINQPSVREEIDKAAASESNENGTMTVYVENKTKLVYEFKYTVDAGLVSSELQSMLEGSYAQETYVSIAKELREEVGDNSITVVVRFKNVDGSVIAEKEYTP